MVTYRCVYCGRKVERRGWRNPWQHMDTRLVGCRPGGERAALPILSTKQAPVLRFIEDFVADRKYPPSIREICIGVGVTSSSTAHSHVQALLWKTYLEIDGGPRTLRVVEPIHEATR